MPDNPAEGHRGIFESLSVMGATLIGIAHTRLELLSLDLEEEREHLVAILLFALIAVFLLGISIVLMTILLVVLFWETHRLLALTLLTLFFFGVGSATAIYALYKVREKPRLFNASLSELQKDQQQLTPPS